MGEILNFAEEHVAAVADLQVKTIRGRSGPATKALRQYFRDILLTNPWYSQDLASLVYADKGKVVGFLGVVPRPMQFKGATVLAATTTQLMVDREQHHGLAGLELLQRLFQGPQDLTFTDGAGEAAHVIWTAAGGQAAGAYSFNWFRLLRPLATLRVGLDRPGGGPGWLGKVSALLSGPGDALAAKLPVGMFRAPVSKFSFRPVTPEQLLSCIQQVGWREALRPAYDARSFPWLMAQAAESRHCGQLCLRAVDAPDGALCGWYVYYFKKGHPALLMQSAVRRRDQFDGALLTLFLDAWQQGSSLIKGRAIPRFNANLTNQHCLFRYPGSSVLVQSRNAALLQAIHTGDAVLSRLDGEAWMRFANAEWD